MNKLVVPNGTVKERNIKGRFTRRVNQLNLTGQSNFQLAGLGEPVPTVTSGFCSWLKGVEHDELCCCCSPSGLERCVFWDAFLLAMVIKSGYLSYYILQFEQVWPFSLDLSLFHQHGIFISKTVTHWIYYYFLHHCFYYTILLYMQIP